MDFANKGGYAGITHESSDEQLPCSTIRVQPNNDGTKHNRDHTWKFKPNNAAINLFDSKNQ